jgi:hypothetical protein
MQFGTVTGTVDFRDTNRIIFVDWTPKVTENFNTAEVINGYVEMTGFQFICLSPSDTASKGRWLTTSGTAALDTCTFTDMATFDFNSTTTATDCVWRRCDQIDPGGGDISRALIDSPTVASGTGAIYWNTGGDPDTKIDGSTIIMGDNDHHAIEFGTNAPLTMNFTDMTFTGFSVSDGQEDSVLLFPDTGSDVTWTIQHTGTVGTVSYKKNRAGDTVVISSSVPVTITVKDEDGNLLTDVQTAVYKTSDRTQIMNEDTVGGVATENYTGSTPVDVEVRCRKTSPGATKYLPYSSLQIIGPGGLTLSVTLIEDPINTST